MSEVSIKFNGKAVEINENSTLESLLISRNFISNKLIIEFNGSLLKSRDEAKEIKLSNGDIINIFSLVAGG